MKHNPKLHERVAALPGHARLHPLQDPEYAQGALELMCNLQGALGEIAGLPHVSLQPSAGSHGELAGLLLTRAYHEDRGEHAHEGAHARHRPRHQPGDGDDGRLRGRQGRHRARRRRRPRRPAREGRRRRRLPDAHQPEHARPVRPQHRGDRRASCTRWGRRSTTTAPTSTRSWASRGPGDMGFDIVHFNLHKTFTQPHGGGGPGRRPDRRVSDRIEPFLPRPQVVRGDAAERRTARASSSTTTGPSRSASCAASRATSACSCAPTPTSARSAATGSRRRRRSRC